jgi:hypothetical protein
MYALLLFGGSLSIDHVKGGLIIRSGDAFVRLKAWPRIGVLVNQLRCVITLGSDYYHSMEVQATPRSSADKLY